MTKLEMVQASELWHPRYNLPVIPTHNNPGIYTALVSRMLDDPSEILASFTLFWGPSFGSWSRWPDGRGGNLSHDEMIGWAYLSPLAADALLRRFVFGFYPNEHGEFEWRRWFPRFVFLMPYLRHRAQQGAGPVGMCLWSAYVLQSALRTKKDNFDADGIIKVWLMCNDPPVRWVARFWRRRMDRIGLQPKDIFETYLRECPTLRVIAPEKFEGVSG